MAGPEAALAVATGNAVAREKAQNRRPGRPDATDLSDMEPFAGRWG